MSLFNKTIEEKKVVNSAGGLAYKTSPELNLINILLTSFVNSQFSNRDSYSGVDELKSILPNVDPLFASKAALYARNVFGMRSITHVLAAELAKTLSGKDYSKKFYESIVSRPDDMLEIISYYKAFCGTKLPNSMKRGFALAFNKFDDYQIAKYMGKTKKFKLIDLVNLVHPVPTDNNKESLRLLVKDELKNTKTWEAKLSKAGQVATSEDELKELKNEAWESLINDGSIGYFALLRNLRNIIEQSPNSVSKALKLLTDEKRILNSKVLPFRFLTAYNEIEKIENGSVKRDVLVALNKALDISSINIPKFDGETLVVLDTSGSMKGKPSQIGSLFSAMLLKSNSCDMMTFDNDARYINYNPSDSILTIREKFSFSGGGTNFHSIFKSASKSYDRIIILSDMQGWVGYQTPRDTFNEYKNKFNTNPYVYSWDLNGDGTLQFPENNVLALAGFSEKIFDIMKLLEEDKKALINTIKNYSF